MNILIDIGHPAQANFFKNVIKILTKKGYKIIITSINRGKLPEILEKEFPNNQIKIIGKHKSSKRSIIFEANILRFFQLLNYVIGKKFNIALSCGSFITGAIFKFILRKPNIQFDDDPERVKNVFLEKLTSSELFFPPIIKPNGKVKIMNALKEWAYLSPTYFAPDPNSDTFLQYNLKPKEYFFIREVSTGSLNYIDQKSNLIASISHLLPTNFKILLSLENKSTINLYPKDWILLQEPVKDIHSLIYYSKIMISSGDSMAREGAMLGVPSIYCGIRDMAANKVMIDKGMLFKVYINDVPELINRIINDELFLENQEDFRNKLKEEWIDVPEFICNIIEKYKK